MQVYRIFFGEALQKVAKKTYKSVFYEPRILEIRQLITKTSKSYHKMNTISRYTKPRNKEKGGSCYV